MSNKSVGQGGYGTGIGIVALALMVVVVVVVIYLGSILMSFFVGVVGNLVMKLLPEEGIDWSMVGEEDA